MTNNPYLLIAADWLRAIGYAPWPPLAPEPAREFPPPPGELDDAITHCDMTTTPNGQLVPVDRRLAEICARCRSGHASSARSPQQIPISR